MDVSQKDRIYKNIVFLLENTILTTYFLAIFQEKDVLAVGDLELLEAKKFDSKSAQVKGFYDIIVTRPGAYGVLKYALEETKQTGASKALNETPIVRIKRAGRRLADMVETVVEVLEDEDVQEFIDAVISSFDSD